MDTFPRELQDSIKTAAIRRLQEQVEGQIRPLGRIQELQDLVERYSPDHQLERLWQTFVPHREIEEMLKRTAIPQGIREIIDGSSLSAQVRRMVDQYHLPDPFGGSSRYNAIMRQASGLVSKTEATSGVAGLSYLSDIAAYHAQALEPISQHQEMLEKLRYRAFGGHTAVDFARQLDEAHPALRAMEAAKKSLDSLWPMLRDIDWSQFDASELDEQETREAADTITYEAAEQASFQEAIDRIVVAIESQQKPTVQLRLWMVLRKLLELATAAALSVLMTHYAPAVLGESPQAAKKAVQSNAQAAVGSPLLLVDYRYVSAKVLVVRQNPRALSPELGRLSFGKPVKLLRKEKDFALVLWTDSESGAEIQGWVFSRHLGKFK